MGLYLIDWAIIGGYLVFALAVGVYFSRRAGKNPEEYYLSGRSLPWWIAGTSMVATTFAADTPLAITEYVRDGGLWKNWFWWNWLLYGLLGVFLFSRLWRRAKVLTDNELMELRYSGTRAAFLRGYKAFHFGIIVNLIFMAWILDGMSSVIRVVLPGAPEGVVLWGLVAIAVVYSLLSGFWGVVMTDLVQFVIAMVGAIVLAAMALNWAGGMGTLLEKLDDARENRAAVMQQMKVVTTSETLGEAEKAGQLESLESELKTIPPVTDGTLRLAPRPDYLEGGTTWEKIRHFVQTDFFKFLVLVLLMWWNNPSTDGGGYLIQRMSACKNERHALLATLWYNLANYALRTWPWVIVALVSLLMFPYLKDYPPGAVDAAVIGDKAGYPLVMRDVLGPGFLGFLTVSFLAAFMSTIDTHLNWGSSYLVHDLYKRFVYGEGDDRHYVMVGRILTIVLIALGAVASQFVGNITGAWQLAYSMASGIGLVLILRWFWWRVNAWSEITALFTSFAAKMVFEIIGLIQTLQPGAPEDYSLGGIDPILFGIPFSFELQLLVIVIVSIVAWLAVTLLTEPEPKEKLEAFYRRVQPGGWWKPVQGDFESSMKPVTKGIASNYVAGLCFVWGTMFAIGHAVLLHWGWAVGNTVLAVGGFAWLWVRCLRPLIDNK